jgi:Zn-dependent protease with chaperone function
MQVLILLTLVFPLLSAPMARTVVARVEPRRATWLLTAAALLLAGTSCGALGLIVLAELVRIPALARLGHYSLDVIAAGQFPSPWTAAPAGVLFGAAVFATGAFAVRRARALGDARRHARELPGFGELVVTGDAAADAYTVPGRPGRIVVSTGMLDVLDESGRSALLAHERAHLASRHHWFTAAARLAAAANPLVRPLATAVEYGVERWADEAAATAVGDRRLVAQAIARAAIAAKATRPQRSVGAVLGAVLPEGRRREGRRRRGALAGAGPVPRRVAALLAPAPRAGLPAIALCLLVLGVAALCALQAADHLQDVLEFARVQLR